MSIQFNDLGKVIFSEEMKKKENGVIPKGSEGERKENGYLLKSYGREVKIV